MCQGMSSDTRYATMLKSNGADVKVLQESLRHANSRISLDVYTQAIREDVRLAQAPITESLLLPVTEEQMTA
jgi:integrase